MVSFGEEVSIFPSIRMRFRTKTMCGDEIIPNFTIANRVRSVRDLWPDFHTFAQQIYGGALQESFNEEYNQNTKPRKSFVKRKQIFSSGKLLIVITSLHFRNCCCFLGFLFFYFDFACGLKAVKIHRFLLWRIWKAPQRRPRGAKGGMCTKVSDGDHPENGLRRFEIPERA